MSENSKTKKGYTSSERELRINFKKYIPFFLLRDGVGLRPKYSKQKL